MGRISSPQGRGNMVHNRRDFSRFAASPSWIDKSRTPENITLADTPLEAAYEQIFGEALAEYNKKQKRRERQIPDYLEHIKNSKNGERPFYEVVFQWGAADDFKGSPATRQKAKDALEEYARTFGARNPSIRVIGAFIHMDESSPHLHLDFVPVATGYTRGMPVRNSLKRALEQQGIVVEGETGRYNNYNQAWLRREREYLGDLCRKQGLIVDPEEKSRGINLTKGELRRQQDIGRKQGREEYTAAAEAVSMTLKTLQNRAEEIEGYDPPKVKKRILGHSTRVEVPSEQYDALTRAAREAKVVAPAQLAERKKLNAEWETARITKNGQLAEQKQQTIGQLARENTELRKENAELRREASRASELEESSKKLNALLNALKGFLRGLWEIVLACVRKLARQGDIETAAEVCDDVQDLSERSMEGEDLDNALRELNNAYDGYDEESDQSPPSRGSRL